MRVVPLVLMSVTLAACHTAPAKPQASDAWIRLPAVPGRPGAAYFTLTGGKSDDALVGVSTPAASRAELHESMKNDAGMMTMQALKSVRLAAGGTVKFAPGAKHVMLFDIDADVSPGGSVPITLTLASGATVKASAHVVAAGQDAPD